MKIYWQHLPEIVEAPLYNDGNIYFSFFHGRQSLDEEFVYSFISAKGSLVTLNPMIVNYLDDETAKDIVWVKTSCGFKKLGDIPEIQWKFKSLGAGEILCDTEFLKI